MDSSQKCLDRHPNNPSHFRARRRMASPCSPNWKLEQLTISRQAPLILEQDDYCVCNMQSCLLAFAYIIFLPWGELKLQISIAWDSSNYLEWVSNSPGYCPKHSERTVLELEKVIIELQSCILLTRGDTRLIHQDQCRLRTQVIETDIDLETLLTHNDE